MNKEKLLNEMYSPKAVAEVVFKTCCPGFSPIYTKDVVDRLIARIEQAVTDEAERCARIVEAAGATASGDVIKEFRDIAKEIRSR